MKTEQLSFSIKEINPTKAKVLCAVGMSEGNDPPSEIESLYNNAHSLFKEFVSPRGICRSISHGDFSEVYKGEGKNAISTTPVELAFASAGSLALCVITLGHEVDRQIDQLMQSSDYALAYMLNAIASESADLASSVVEAAINERFITEGEKTRTLMYSPGYCGWHITAQKKLFNYLKPETIGVTINDSCLMMPIKSVSGVMITGDASIHKHRPIYDFCNECKSRTCIKRGRD